MEILDVALAKNIYHLLAAKKNDCFLWWVLRNESIIELFKNDGQSLDSIVESERRRKGDYRLLKIHKEREREREGKRRGEGCF